MSSSRPHDLLRWQFDLTWSLLEYHLERLEPADLLWEPAAVCWTLRPGPGGVWTPDWADTEPDPIPVPTIGWVTWHLGWWWSVVLDHAHGRPPRDRADIVWPGDVVVAWLRDLRGQWLGVLPDLDLAAVAPFPWDGDPDHSVAHMVTWVNAELMKNVAEIGQLRVLRAARSRDQNSGRTTKPGTRSEHPVSPAEDGGFEPPRA